MKKLILFLTMILMILPIWAVEIEEENVILPSGNTYTIEVPTDPEVLREAFIDMTIYYLQEMETGDKCEADLKKTIANLNEALKIIEEKTALIKKLEKKLNPKFLDFGEPIKGQLFVGGGVSLERSGVFRGGIGVILFDRFTLTFETGYPLNFSFLGGIVF